MTSTSDRNHDDSIWKWYMKVIHGAGAGDINAWTKLDLTMPQMKVLMILNMRGDSTVGTLAEMLKTSLPNTTGILDRLEAQGLVDRIPSKDDRRVIMIRPTSDARNIFHELSRSGFEKMNRVIRGLNDSQRKTVEQGLQILAAALDKDEAEDSDHANKP